LSLKEDRGGGGGGRKRKTKKGSIPRRWNRKRKGNIIIVYDSYMYI
jgi:hypothetical protein